MTDERKIERIDALADEFADEWYRFKSTPEGEWVSTRSMNDKMRRLLLEAVNEICEKCEKRCAGLDVGCHGCKWLAVKKGEIR